MDDIKKAIQKGLKYQNAGRILRAESVYKQILRRNPNHPDALLLLGGLAHKAKKFNTAVELINKAISSKPNDPFFHASLGLALLSLGKLDSAAEAYGQAIKLKPDYAEAWNTLGAIMQDLGNIDDALNCYQKALQYRPDYINAYINMGNGLMEIGQYVAALDSFHKALHIKPDYAETWNNLGNALKSLGKMENAIESYRKAISHKPDYAAAYFALAQTKQHTEYDGDMTAMETLLGKSGITDKEKVQICFGLGKAFEDLKQYDEAFNYFQNGNRIKRNMFDYSISAERVFFDKLVKVFDKKFFDQRKGCGCNRDVPIFVLGMPRSGTTLVEQILASHYQVFGAGELSDIKQLLFEQNHELRHETFPENVSGFDLKVFTQLGEEYIRRISRYNIDRKDYVTDKMPFNTLFIGMIKVILPMAKVIHCRRNPVDTCLSCYKADFNEYKKFSYDLTEIGQYYRLYHNLMTHWHEVLPDFIYDVQYEDLVADQELQTRQLLDFCGLPWHEACLSFHTLDRKIKTASFSQARQPLYKSSVHSWKRYEKHLGPLLEALGPGEKGKK